MCGENASMQRFSLLTTGSPPRVRGKLRRAHLSDWHVGITPACAGKTSNLLHSSCQARDHPRVCGENNGWVYIINADAGSPPRVRGKHCINNCGCGASVDHPRVCGENLMCAVASVACMGSPPRVRGKPCMNLSAR